MPGVKLIIQGLLVALIAPWLYDRYVAFGPMLANRPSTFQNLHTFKKYEVKYRDQLRNCEDIIVEKSLGLAFMSCDPGRDRWNTVMGTFAPPKSSIDNAAIYVLDYATPSIPDSSRLTRLTITPSIPDFHPLGLAYDPWTSTLYIANHPRSSPSHLLLLTVNPAARTATLTQSLTHPLLHAPNSILPLGNGQLYVTNDHTIRAAVSPLLSKLETFAGVPGGTVVFVDTAFPSATRVVARVPFANGVEALNEMTVAVASSSKAGVYLFERAAGDFSLALKKVVRTPAAVDNLATESDGTLLLAGHPFAIGLMKVSKGRPGCEPGSEGEELACACTAPSWAAEWSEERGLVEVYKDDGREFCSSSTMVRDSARGFGALSGLYERGLLVFET